MEYIKDYIKDLYNNEVGYGNFTKKIDELIDIFQLIKKYPALVKYVEQYKDYRDYFLDDSIIPFIDKDAFEKVQNWFKKMEVNYGKEK